MIAKLLMSLSLLVFYFTSDLEIVGAIEPNKYSGYQMSKDVVEEIEPVFFFDSDEMMMALSDEELQVPHVLWSNGDIRLVSNFPYEMITTAGRLEVYMQTLYGGSGQQSGGSWGTLCAGNSFTLKEAHVLCRQMGFKRALKWEYAINTDFGVGNESAPIQLAGVKCSKSSLQHILRCKHSGVSSSELTYSCDHSQDVALFCDSEKIWDNPYRGQIRLANNNSLVTSFGRLEVYQGGQWGTVCKRNFHLAAADSVCRQLGYTGAMAIFDALPGSGLVWVDELTCDTSRPCFTYCFTHNMWTHNCNHTQDVAVQCNFDVSQASQRTAGYRSKCEISLFPLSMLILGITLALCALLLFGCAVVICVVVIRCCRRKYRYRNGFFHYQELS